jgi:hypothetical protein
VEEEDGGEELRTAEGKMGDSAGSGCWTIARFWRQRAAVVVRVLDCTTPARLLDLPLPNSGGSGSCEGVERLNRNDRGPQPTARLAGARSQTAQTLMIRDRAGAAAGLVGECPPAAVADGVLFSALRPIAAGARVQLRIYRSVLYLRFLCLPLPSPALHSSRRRAQYQSFLGG